MNIRLKQAMACTALIVTGFLVMPAIAFATDPPIDPTGPINLNDTTASIRISAQLVTLIVGALIPLLVGLLTTWKSRHRGALMILFNIFNSLIATATLSDGTAVFSQQMIVNIVPGIVGSLMAYYGLYKPAGITSSPVPVPGPTQGESVLVPGKLSDVGVH